MRRHLSGWTVLLLFAVLFVVGLIWVRGKPPKVEDPLAEAAEEVSQRYGFLVESESDPKGGVMVKAITPGSPAALLGLQVGDRVIAVSERSVWHAVQLGDLLEERLSRGPTPLLVVKGGVYRQVVFGRRAAGPAGPGAARPGAPPSRAPTRGA